MENKNNTNNRIDIEHKLPTLTHKHPVLSPTYSATPTKQHGFVFVYIQNCAYALAYFCEYLRAPYYEVTLSIYINTHFFR